MRHIRLWGTLLSVNPPEAEEELRLHLLRSACDFGFRVRGWGLEFGGLGFGFEIWGSGFWIEGIGIICRYTLRVQGSGLSLDPKVSVNPADEEDVKTIGQPDGDLELRRERTRPQARGGAANQNIRLTLAWGS